MCTDLNTFTWSRASAEGENSEQEAPRNEGGASNVAESDTDESEPRQDLPQVSGGSSSCARDLKSGVDTEFITPTTNGVRSIRARPLKDENGSSVELFKTSSVILSRALPNRSSEDLVCVTDLRERGLANCATPRGIHNHVNRITSKHALC